MKLDISNLFRPRPREGEALKTQRRDYKIQVPVTNSILLLKSCRFKGVADTKSRKTTGGRSVGEVGGGAKGGKAFDCITSPRPLPHVVWDLPNMVQPSFKYIEKPCGY